MVKICFQLNGVTTSETSSLYKWFSSIVFERETFVLVGALNHSVIQKFQFAEGLCNVVAETGGQLSIEGSIL